MQISASVYSLAAISLVVMLPTTARSQSDLQLMLVNGGAIIGQAIACKISDRRLLPVMAAQAATVEVLSSKDSKTIKLRDDIIKLAADNERSKNRCGEIERAFSIFEKTLRDRGLMK